MGGGSKKGGSQTVGYKYFAGVHLVPCLGPVDSVDEIRVGDRTAWTGNETGSTQVFISKPELFGGESREGGVRGKVDFMFGEPGQAPNPYLQSHVLTDSSAAKLPSSFLAAIRLQVGNALSEEGYEDVEVPAFRGVLSLVFRRFYWTAMNPYFKPVAVRVSRMLAGWGSAGAFYPSKAVIPLAGYDHMNPAHIIYQCFTDTDWGMRRPRTDLDSSSFTAAADTLYNEGFGLSLRWTQQESIEDFVQLILDHINGVVVTDLSTGLIKLKLIRADYDPATLPVLSPSNVIELNSFQRKGWGETTNELTVEYTDVEDGQAKSVTVQNLANIRAQGAVVTDSRELPGLPTAALASRVAQRDLETASSPLASLNLTSNRRAFPGGIPEPGDVFKLNWPDLGLAGVIFRAVEVDVGRIGESRIQIDAVEDVFGLPAEGYVKPQPAAWADPIQDPLAVQTYRLDETPYYIVQRNLKSYEIDELEPEFGFVRAFARKPELTSINYTLHNATTAGGPFEVVETADFAPHANLAADIGPMDTTITFSSPRGVEDVETGTLAYLGDEAVEVTALDAGAGTATIARGVIDTVPASHTAGDEVWFDAGARWGVDPTEWALSDTVYYRMTPRNGQGEFPLSSASDFSITLANRFERPYPPGQFQINSSYFPGVMQGGATLAWAHRDRLQQTAGLNDFTEGDIGPEAGTTYTIRFYGETGTLIKTVSGIAGTSFSYGTEATDSGLPGGRLNNLLRVELESERDTLVSWQAHDHTTRRVGYGYSYGFNYGGL